MNLDKKYWSERYDNNEAGWNIGYVSTPIKAYIDQIENKDLRILVPGAGYGHEVVYLFDQGFTNVTVIDLVASALLTIDKALPKHHGINLIEGDFFKHQGAYDLIIEQTFFCALNPELRAAYGKHMSSLIAKDGKLSGVFFNRTFERQGPPFGGSITEYVGLFEPYFSSVLFDACYNSIPSRAGSECFGVLKK